MTLSEILSTLADVDPKAALTFTADGETVGAGYHVTEFQTAQIRSMTCGGTLDGWNEARVQIMDGHGTQEPMQVGRFLHIAGLVMQRFPEMADLPLSIEYAPGNAGLHIYQPGAVQVTRDGVTLPLNSDQAQCKAITTTSCCGTSDVCCAAA